MCVVCVEVRWKMLRDTNWEENLGICVPQQGKNVKYLAECEKNIVPG